MKHIGIYTPGRKRYIRHLLTKWAGEAATVEADTVWIELVCGGGRGVMPKNESETRSPPL